MGAILLANDRATCESDAEVLFDWAAQGREPWDESSYQLDDETPTFATSDWYAAGVFAQRFLPQVARFERISTIEKNLLLDEFNENLRSLEGMRIQVTRTGLTAVVMHDSVLAVAVRGLLPFLLPDGWPSTRLGICQFEKCSDWFLRPHFQRGSVPQYCSRAHSNAARQGDYRRVG